MGTWLHRFSVKPNHLDQYLEIWPELVALRRRHGYDVIRAFVETDAEPKFTWLYSHPQPALGEAKLAADPTTEALAQQAAPHVFRNVKIRHVHAEALTRKAAPDQIAVMRRYSIVGDWDEFLDLWRQVVPLREQFGFPCLFAVADFEEHMFTWAFGYDGAWEDFRAAQRDYYHDPARMKLRGIFDYMADYSIHPARQLELPE